MDRERSRSKVLRRAETAGRALSDGSPSPANLRVVQDALVQDHYSFSGDVAGVGVNGAVRVVTDRRTNQRRVVKSIVHANAKDGSQWSELLNEMEVYLRLDHPNICRLLEVYVQEDAIHLIMELCTGKDLFERWDVKGRYTELETAIAVMQMLDALQYLHSHEVCHRDLKLENWVYADQTPNARLKLIDFGFSKVVTPNTPMTAVLGTAFYIAPEVLAGCYDCKCDVWSTGVITYMLLAGTPPFGDFDEPDATILQKVKRGTPLRFTSREWKGISQDARNFVTSLLTRDPAKRPSAQEAATHLWLQQGAKGGHCQAPEISKEVLENLRSFASMNVIKRAACCLIAYSMSVEETDYLEAQFKKLDKGRNGTISLQELVDALKETLNMTEATARDLFTQLVLTGDREIHYSEFLAAASQKRFLSQEGFIREAFNRFDVDKTGYISVDDLRSVLGDEYCGTRVEDILAQVDASGDGLIEYEEFVRALMDLGTYVPEKDQSRPRAIVQRISKAFDFTSLGGLSKRLARSWPRGLCSAGNGEEHMGMHSPPPFARAISDECKPKLERAMGHTRSLSDSAKAPRSSTSAFASEAIPCLSEEAAAPAVEASM